MKPIIKTWFSTLYWLWLLLEASQPKKGKEALLLTIEDSIEYRSFKYTKTCCKCCAAIEDGIVPEMKLYARCMKNWHYIKYDLCPTCNQEEFENELKFFYSGLSL